MISFRQRFPIPVSNHLTGEEYLFLRGDEVAADDARIAEVVAIANEPLVYGWLFKERCRGESYTADLAVDWLERIRDGWEKNSQFRFLVTDLQGRITAACDIRSAEPEGAEIGYWASAAHPGIMTNAVTAMIDCAWEAGYRSLTARVLLGNDRSGAVLERVGFRKNPALRDDEQDHYFIERPGG